MKKIILAFVAIFALVCSVLTLCIVLITKHLSKSVNDYADAVKVQTEQFFMPTKITGGDMSGAIYKDEYTGVLYYATGYKLTAIMEPDGTCLTWDEWKERNKKSTPPPKGRGL